MYNNFSSYQADAISHAIYPKDTRFLYPALGLAGEAGELDQKLYELASDDAIDREAGDVLWYIANLSRDLDLDMEDIWQEARFIDIGLHTLSYDVGQVCEKIKKHFRDGLVLEPAVMKTLLARVMAQLDLIAAENLGTGLLHIATRNIEKLNDRASRGVIMGSGDNR